jgi:hypothetical protein
MKTGFALSFPAPVVIFDTELGAPPLFRHFVECPVCKRYTPHDEVRNEKNEVTAYICKECKDPNGKMKEIYWCDATFMNPQGAHDPAAALQSLEMAIKMVSQVKAKTVIIDQGTDVWDWLQEWLDDVGKHTQKGDQLMRTEWYKARLKWKKFLLEIMAQKIHFVMTAAVQDVWDKTLNKASGEVIPRVEKTTTHAFDIEIKMKRYEIPQGDGKPKKCEYHSDITKCRFQKGWRPVLPQELTFEKLTKKLQEDLGIQVW